MTLPADVRAHIEQRRRIFAATISTLGAIWQGVNLRDEDDYYRRVLPPVNAAIGAQAAMASAWIARRAGTTPQAPALPYERLRGGKTQREVYRRPLLEVGRQIGLGVDYGAARQAAGRRLSVIAQTDQQTAYVQRATDVLSRPGMPARYRRVVSGANSCSRCVSAAGQIVYSQEIMPRHDGCACSVWPLVGDDPGPLVADAAEAPEIDVKVEQHAELGPVLVDARHQFTPLGG